jgi:DNA-binding transcriptional MerR regulator
VGLGGGVGVAGGAEVLGWCREEQEQEQEEEQQQEQEQEQEQERLEQQCRQLQRAAVCGWQPKMARTLHRPRRAHRRPPLCRRRMPA